MKYCPNCGHPNEDGNAFCKQCGTPLKKTVPNKISERGASGQHGKSGGANRNMKILVIVLALVAVIAIAAVIVLALRLEKPQPALPAAEQSSAESGAAVEARPIEQPQLDPPDVLPASGGDQPAAPAAAATPTPDPTPDPYYQNLLRTVAAYDSRIVLPPEELLYAPEQVQTKYVQGIYGQGIRLMSAPENGENFATLTEGTRLTVYAAQAGHGLVQTEDGRYGWVTLQRLEDRFDPELSYQRKRDFLIDSPNDWTNPTWYSFIMEHADDLPPEVVKAARDAKK